MGLLGVSYFGFNLEFNYWVLRVACFGEPLLCVCVDELVYLLVLLSESSEPLCDIVQYVMYLGGIWRFEGSGTSN